MRKIDYVVYVHRYYDNGRVKPGGLDYVIEYLINEGRTLLIVESPLFPKLYREIVVTVVNNKVTESILKFSTPFKSDSLTWITGVLIDIYMALKYGSRNAIAITSDPLTSLPAVILRKAGYFTYHYFHCIDYSDTRFKNKVVDAVYKLLRNISFKYADSVGCVSKAIYTKVSSQKHKSLVYIPNSPSYKSYEKFRVPIEGRNRKDIVLTCLGISKRYMVLETVMLFNEVLKSDKLCKLIIIGSLDLDPTYYKQVVELIAQLKITENIIFKGYVSRDENCRIIGRSGVGVCFYNKEDSFAKYADSLKIREYAGMGIPCVADTVTSTALEMHSKGAGVAVEAISESKASLIKLLEDLDYYTEVSNNSLTWAKEMDKDILLKELLTDYLERDKHAK